LSDILVTKPKLKECEMRNRSFLSVGLLIVICGGVLGFAPAERNATLASSDAVLPAEADVAGLSLAEWSARSWQWSFSLPADANPFSDETGAQCGFGQSGPVFFLAGAERSTERACVIPLGVHIFVPLAGSECSNVEAPPFFGRNEAELQQCATSAVEMAKSVLDMTAMRLTVDDQDITDFSTYRAVTPLMTLWLPESNVLGSASKVAESVADGYQVLLRPLSVGEHVVTIVIPGPQPGQTVTITYRLTVIDAASATASGS
jgi:hypothetical protein